MKKADRLLGQLSVEALCRLYATSGTDPALLRALRDELKYRKPSKTEVLRSAVNRHFVRGADRDSSATTATTGVPAPVVLTCVKCRTKLRLRPTAAAIVARCPHCGQEFDVTWSGSSCLVVPHVHANPSSASSTTSARPLTLAQAYAYVGVSPSDPWEPTVKKASRSLMQQYHPDKCAGAPPAVQKLAETEFKRVKEAYELLERSYRSK